MQISSPIQINANALQSQSAGQPKGADIFKGVSVGETIKVEVVETTGKAVTLKMPSGELIKADFPAEVIVMPGDVMELMLSSREHGQVQLRFGSLNGQSINLESGELQVKLMDLGVEPSVVNTRIAQFLIDRGLQPTPERINNLLRVVTQFPELPAAVALFMAENNILPNAQNANILMQWYTDTGTLGDQALELASLLNQMGAAGADGQAQGAIAFTEAFMSVVNENKAALPQSVTQTEAFTELLAKLPGMSEAEARVAIAEFARGTGMEPGQRVEVAQVLAAAYRAGSAAQAEAQPDAGAMQPGQTAEGQQAGQTVQNAAPEQGQNIAGSNNNQNTAQTPIEGQNTPGQAQTAQQPGQTIDTQTTQPQPAQADGQQQTGVANPPGDPATVQPGQANAPQQGGQVAASPDGQAQPNNAPQAGQNNPVLTEGNRAAVSAQIKQLVTELSRLTVQMRRDAPLDAQVLQDAVRSQQGIADSVRNGVISLAGEQSQAAQRAGDLSTQIQLGNQLENFYYCQIPFEVAQKQNTAELFVFERKKKGEEGERVNTTFLIALDTEFMGRIETVMRAQENVLALDLRVQTSAVQKFLSEETEELAELLKEEDFDIREIKVSMFDVPTTPMNAHLLMDESEAFSLQTVDIKI